MHQTQSNVNMRRYEGALTFAPNRGVRPGFQCFLRLDDNRVGRG